MWETAFDVVDPNLFDCSVNRTKAQDTATQLGLINHFLDVLVLGQPAPDVAKANITNGASGPGSLGAQVNACIALNSRSPNFMLVDVNPPCQSLRTTLKRIYISSSTSLAVALSSKWQLLPMA